jgi:hypothetical protein
MLSLFTNQEPNFEWSDGTPYELGMKFQSARAGQITAIRFWKSANEPGNHIGRIWTVTGTQIAQVAFTNETASGWQQQTLSSPLNILANTTYIVTVNCNDMSALRIEGLETPIVNGDLRSVSDGSNGVFSNSLNTFPTQSFRNSNYFRDIVFVPGSSITKVSGDNQFGTAGSTLPSSLVVQVRNSNGTPQSGVTINFAVTSGGGSVSPTSAVTDSNGQASTRLTLGTTLGATNTVTATAANIGTVVFTATEQSQQAAPQKLFTNQTPSFEWSDGTPYELGMKFQSAKAGQITAIRYWKSANEPGTHTGKIWTATGTELAEVTFTNETGSGWQQQALSTPLSILPDTTYVVSVNCNDMSTVTFEGLETPIVNGDLRTIADGNNGVFSSVVNAFPTQSFRNSNYFRDIVFVPGSSVTKLSGDSQFGTAGSTLTEPLVVQVLGSNGAPQPGATINFAVTSGGGSVSPTSAVTDANGQASTVLTLGTTAGTTNTVNATASTASGVIGSISFIATTVPVNSNAITLENLRKGNPDWSQTNWVTPSAPEILGYAATTSVNKGGSLAIKVSLAQPGQYRIDVYRLGYYNGAGARLVFSRGSLNGITQPNGTVDSATRLFACNWSTSYTLAVGTDWTSGVYIAKLTDQRTGKQSLVWFVVRDDNSTSDILFQSSFTTFLAYNNSGGYSLYPHNSIDGQRAFKVSYDRPFAAASITPPSPTSPAWQNNNSLLTWEYNMLRWLEAQGYDVSYVTNMNVHTNAALLRQHKVFMSVGHDEYWSREARTNVEQARDNNGVNLTFFSANTCYWRVRFESSSTGAANRIMACYKDDWSLDPVAPTTRFRATPNNNPENSLLGVLYTGERLIYSAGFDFVVKNSRDPYYANTGLRDGDRLPLLVGFEWDAVVNNGATPNNLVILSESSVVSDAFIPDLPSGTNREISHAVRYTAPSGAKVFSTGSIQWMWGLDDYNVSPKRKDIRAQQIAVNVLASMGAKPTIVGPNIVVP